MNTTLIDNIPSFKRDHTIMEPGLYLQEHKFNIFTFDLRFVAPNTRFIPISAIHTIEHLFASWLKKSEDCQIAPYVVSFNPGGCQTMFYLEIHDSIMNRLSSSRGSKCGLFEVMINNLVDCINWCLQQTEVPGATPEECGNYKSHDLFAAKSWLSEYQETLKSMLFEPVDNYIIQWEQKTTRKKFLGLL